MELTQEYVRNLFEYKDGILYWKVNTAWSINIGDKAGYLNPNGYDVIRINRKLYGAHRLIFLYHNGYLPKQIDHIDRNPSNNKIENLREITNAQNMMNSKKQQKLCSSKYKGICWNKINKKWISRIQINGKRINLGYFTNELDAAIAYNEKVIELYGEYAYLNEVK